MQVLYDDSSIHSIYFKEGINLPKKVKIYEVYPDMSKYKEIFNK